MSRDLTGHGPLYLARQVGNRALDAAALDALCDDLARVDSHFWEVVHACNCSDLRGSEGLKVENRGLNPVAAAQHGG